MILALRIVIELTKLAVVIAFFSTVLILCAVGASVILPGTF